MDNRFFEYNTIIYPDFIRRGNHTQYILPIAQKFCIGKGIDIGCGNSDWSFPGAQQCDITLAPPWNDATKLPCQDNSFDFIFSSHCLEHIPDYFLALNEWTRVLRKNGIIFLYIPSIDCEYWRPANNKKHRHIFRADDLRYDLNKLGYKPILISATDLAYSFAIVGVKAK